MKTLLNNIKKIDDYLCGNLNQEDQLLFEARLVIDPLLKWQVVLQRKVIHLAKLYGRRKTRSEIITISERLFEDPLKDDFRKSVHQAFENK